MIYISIIVLHCYQRHHYFVSSCKCNRVINEVRLVFKFGSKRFHSDALAYSVCSDENTTPDTPRTNEEQEEYCNLMKIDVIVFSVIYLVLTLVIEIPTMYLARRYLKITSSQSPSTVLLISE